MRPLVGTSLKMNLTSSEAAHYLDVLCPLVAPFSSCDLFVLPPFTSIWVARERLQHGNVAWGAQDVHPADSGPHTGDVSAPMLADLGCTYVEVGHSERRRDHGETDGVVGLKVAQVLRHGMTPIVCVGETADGGPESALRVVLPQVRSALQLVPLSDRGRPVIAYEPVWAIGVAAAAADPRHAGAVHRGIHDFLRTQDGGGVALRVVYGGSVDRDSATPLLEQDGVDGLFVGRAALDPRHFAAIAAQAEELAGPR